MSIITPDGAPPVFPGDEPSYPTDIQPSDAFMVAIKQANQVTPWLGAVTFAQVIAFLGIFDLEGHIRRELLKMRVPYGHNFQMRISREAPAETDPSKCFWLILTPLRLRAF